MQRRLFAVLGPLILASLAGALSAVRLAADEAELPTGKRLPGTLELDARGRLRFVPAGQPGGLPVSELRRVRFSASPSVRLAALHRVTLRSGEQLTGELIELTEKELALRPAWAEVLTVPRAAIAAVTQLPGQVTVLAEDFEDNRNAWQRSGSPERSDWERVSGKHSLRLAAPGQAVEHSLADAVEAGRVELHFRAAEQTAGARWLVEAEWGPRSGGRKPPEPHRTRIVLAGAGKEYAVESDEAGGAEKPLPRSPGWHRLSLRFAPAYLLLGVDGQLLWDAGQRGPGGSLRKLRLACEAAGGAESVQGEVYFDDVIITRAIDPLPHRSDDVAQDEVWLLSGDQLFGQLLHADRRRVALQTRAGRQTFPWSEVRSLFLRRAALTPQTTDGEHVRIRLASDADGEADELEGVLTALDARRLVLRHPRLGEVAIARSRLQELRGLFHGRRIELDNAFHHLGDPTRIVPELQPARAEAASLRRPFRLDAVPPAAHLVVGVVHPRGPGDASAAAPAPGGRGAEVIVNGKSVAVLPLPANQSSPQPARVALPRSCLRAGENVLELRLTADCEAQRPASCGVYSLALELPR
jgi:hypothetical protein